MIFSPTVSAGSNVTINAELGLPFHATGADSNQDSLTYT